METTVTLKAGKQIKQNGYSLVIVMIAVLVSGILSGSASSYAAYALKKTKENELLFRGQAYQKAILSYYQAVPVKQRRYPKSLNDLLYDSRFAHRRHLRYLYTDPMTKGDWRVLRSKDGGILGVASTYNGKPFKKSFFPVALSHFEKAEKYSDWRFEVR